MFLDKSALIVIHSNFFKLMDLLKLGYTHKQAALLVKNID